MKYGFWEAAYKGAVHPHQTWSDHGSWARAADAEQQWESDALSPDINGNNKFFNHFDLSGSSRQDKVHQFQQPGLKEQPQSGPDPAQQPAPPAKQPSLLKKIRHFLNEIWINIQLNSKEMPKSILVSSANRGEGVTFISFHMALFLALEYNRKVLYVDTNINKKHKSFLKLSNVNGLLHYLTSYADIQSIIYQTNYENLSIVPSGYPAQQADLTAALYPDQSLENFVDYCTKNYDVVIYDGQAIVSSPETIYFAKLVDQCVLVCRYAKTRREVTNFVLEKMNKHNINLAGMILNFREYPTPTVVYRFLK